MDLKNRLTKYIAESIDLCSDPKEIKKLRFLWWENPRTKEDGGFRLTPAGFRAMQAADIKFHKIRYQEPILLLCSNNFILDLDHLISCPFYITNRAVFVTDDKIAVQLILFSGNINKFIYSKKRAVNKCLTAL